MLNRNISGILPIDKPSGISSYDAIRALKKTVKVKKIGHAGTLDLFASGVLPILIGEATKVFDYLLRSDKVYHAIVQFGAVSDTDDPDGTIQQISGKPVSESGLNEVLPQFIGSIEQTAPKYSALKINGKRSSDLVRENIEVRPKTRTVKIHEIDLIQFDPAKQCAELSVRCGSGTYIRSLARDIGRQLENGAYLKELRRLRSGGVELDDCFALESISADTWPEKLISINTALKTFPALNSTLPKDYFINGRALTEKTFQSPAQAEGIYRVLSDDRLTALVAYENGKYKYKRVFHQT